MRISKEESLFIAVDYQKKLMPVIKNRDEILENACFLIRGLKALGIPMYQTTQYEKGLGPNVKEVEDLIGRELSLDKITFGICDDPAIRERILSAGKRFVILAGTEAHICVLQSVLGILELGLVPVLVTDCTGSRNDADKETAFLRAQKEGAVLTGSESLLYELMKSAKDPAFKTITCLVKERDAGRKEKQHVL